MAGAADVRRLASWSPTRGAYGPLFAMRLSLGYTDHDASFEVLEANLYPGDRAHWTMPVLQIRVP